MPMRRFARLACLLLTRLLASDLSGVGHGLEALTILDVTASRFSSANIVTWSTEVFSMILLRS